jgi:hypothetical protein
MDKTTKTVLIIIGSLLLVCACGAGVLFAMGLWSFRTIARVADSSTSRDLAEVANMLSEVAVITLPDGFGSPYGIHIADITSVGFASQSKNTHILITQFPQGTVVNTEEMLKLISKYSTNPDNPWDTSNTRVIEEASDDPRAGYLPGNQGRDFLRRNYLPRRHRDLPGQRRPRFVDDCRPTG